MFKKGIKFTTKITLGYVFVALSALILSSAITFYKMSNSVVDMGKKIALSANNAAIDSLEITKSSSEKLMNETMISFKNKILKGEDFDSVVSYYKKEYNIEATVFKIEPNKMTRISTTLDGMKGSSISSDDERYQKNS